MALLPYSSAATNSLIDCDIIVAPIENCDIPLELAYNSIHTVIVDDAGSVLEPEMLNPINYRP